jgi:hypothetical protein
MVLLNPSRLDKFYPSGEFIMEMLEEIPYLKHLKIIKIILTFL